MHVSICPMSFIEKVIFPTHCTVTFAIDLMDGSASGRHSICRCVCLSQARAVPVALAL